MANPYLELFSAPGSKAFSLAGLIARMPISMLGIGIITMLAQLRGSYWLAGAVAATFAFSMALLAPQISRAVDRLGQRRVLPCVTAVSVAGMLSLLFCTHYQAPDGTLFVFAAVSGCMPSMPAMAITALPLLLVDDIFTLAATVFVAGLFFAPTMIIAMGLVENIVPPSRLTEGLTWMITGLGIGVALGAALAGWVVDEAGVKAGFIITLSAGLVVLLVAAAGYRLMQKSVHAA